MHKIGIHSVPRSGSNWLGAILDSHPDVLYKHQPLFSYRFKGFLNEHSSTKEIDKYFLKITNTADDFIDRKEKKTQGLVPDFNKNKIYSTLAYKENRYHYILNNLLHKKDNIQIIGLIRNPLSVISSWIKAPREFDIDNWKVEEEWRSAPKKNQQKREEYFGYEKWKEIIFLFERLQNRYPNQFYLLNYETLLHHKTDATKDVFSFCGLNLHQQTINFLERSSSIHKENTYAVFKTKKRDDGWKKNLPEYIIDAIMKDQDFIEFNKKYQWV
jgi:hypothetical protein